MSWSDIPGWTCPRLLEFYDELAASMTGGVFVEVGVAYGRSLAYFASKARPEVQILGVDSWLVKMGRGNPEVWEKVGRYADAHTAADAMLFDCGVRARIELCLGNSVDVARALDFEVDAVFVDGSHEYESVAADIRAWLPRVKSGGILAGHDINDHYPGVRRAAMESASGIGVPLEVRYPVHPETWGGIWIIRNP